MLVVHTMLVVQTVMVVLYVELFGRPVVLLSMPYAPPFLKKTAVFKRVFLFVVSF